MIGRIIAWLKARDLAEIALGAEIAVGIAVGFLMAGVLFSAVQIWVMDSVNERTKAQIELASKDAQRQVDLAIENAQLQVADAVFEANKFRNSLICAADPIIDVCQCWKPRVRQ